MVWFVYHEQNQPYDRTDSSTATNHIGLVWQHLRRTAGREEGYTLAAALEECLELLGILQNNQGRSQAAPLAASRQRTRCRDRPQPQLGSRMLRAPYILEKEQKASPASLPPASLPSNKPTTKHSNFQYNKTK